LSARRPTFPGAAATLVAWSEVSFAVKPVITES
jgi:hypothetical protein